MQPWAEHRDARDEPVIDLGEIGDDEYEPASGPPPSPPAPERSATRLGVLLSTVALTALAAVGGTLLVSSMGGGEPEPRPQPSTMDELWQHTEAELAAAVGAEAQLLMVRTFDGPHPLVVPAGSYGFHFKCGLLRDGQARAVTIQIELATSAGDFSVQVPCPSTVIRMENTVTFDRIGAIQLTAWPESGDMGEPLSLGVALVPEGN